MNVTREMIKMIIPKKVGEEDVASLFKDISCEEITFSIRAQKVTRSMG